MPPTPPSETDPALLRAAEQFGADVADLLNGTITDDAPIEAVVVERGHVLVGAYDDRLRHVPIPLSADGIRLVDLKIHHQCSWDFTGSFLAVEESSIAVLPAKERDPLIRFHYERQRGWASAHVHAHAERDLIGFLLAGRDPSKAPRLRSLHIPVGGRRFRPSIEDIIEFVVEEFGITTKAGWRDRIADQRQTWEEVQLSAAVRDVLRADPERLRAYLHQVVDRAYQDVIREGPNVSS